jgi:hypothetical protein
MMPRLTPRRSPRRPSSGVENASPLPRMKRSNSMANENTASAAYDHQQVVSSSSSHVARMPQNPQRLQEQNPALPRRRVLSAKKPAAPLNLNAPLSPSPASLLLPPPFEPAFKSPIPNELRSDTNNNSDWTLTPPTTGLRPLVVSAKRLGKDVRRKHSKRRRCRSRAAKNGNGFCLWQESHDSTTPAESSSDEDEALPFLFSQQEVVSPSEKKKQYWEWCYGKEEIEPSLSTQEGWSAKRAPPAKGWCVVS